MMISKKLFALLMLMAAITSLSACSSVPDRYAFWSDDIGNVHDTSAPAPSLGDVPAKPDVDQVKDDLQEMRQRLKTDQYEAYGTQIPGDGAYLDYQPVAPAYEANPDVIAATSAPIFTPNSVEINYGALQDNTYIYSSSPALYGQYYQDPANYAFQQPVSYGYGRYDGEIVTLMSQNPSVTINPLPNYDSYDSGSSLLVPEGQLFFGHGSSRLSAEDKTYIKELADSLQSSYLPLRIVGHASTRVELKDPFKARLVNLQMSEKRAAAVYKEFKKHGIAAERLHMTAHGDSVPNLTIDGLTEEAADRRVEILVE